MGQARLLLVDAGRRPLAVVTHVGGASVGEGGYRLADLDDVGGEHLSGAGAEVGGVVGHSGWDEEAVAGVEEERGLVLDLHLYGAGDDVADFFAGMGVPARGDPDGNLGADLDHFAAGDRQWAALDLGALECCRERVGRFGLRYACRMTWLVLCGCLVQVSAQRRHCWHCAGADGGSYSVPRAARRNAVAWSIAARAARVWLSEFSSMKSWTVPS